MAQSLDGSAARLFEWAVDGFARLANEVLRGRVLADSGGLFALPSGDERVLCQKVLLVVYIDSMRWE